jgi:transposase-like protein
MCYHQAHTVGSAFDQQLSIAMQRFTFKDLNKAFPDDAVCLEWLRAYLYPDGIACKVCGRVTKHHRIASRPSYSCDVCGHHVHPTAGTIFHKSSTSLITWFHAIYLMASTRCGISAKQIERETGVTYKTAWRMFKHIQSMLAEDIGALDGRVEMDDTYMGGRRKYGAGRAMRGEKMKAAVLGIVQRNGKAKSFAIPAVDGATLLGHVIEHVKPGAIVYTDELYSYNGLAHTRSRFDHRTIKHKTRKYVDGDKHTNFVEGPWSIHQARNPWRVLPHQPEVFAALSQRVHLPLQPA